MKLAKKNRTSQDLTSLILLVLFILFISGCAKSGNAPASPADASSFDAQLASIKEKAQSVASGMQSNDSNYQEQVIISPLQQKQQIAEDVSIFSANYHAPCIVQKYKIINSYCGMKTYWLQQSEIVSWHVPYWLVLLLVLILFIIWWRLKKGN